jgi:error-prone DNA polymerase
MGDFVELHCHSAYSFLEGASTPEQLAEEAARLGMGALALTDTNGLYGAMPFIRACRSQGVKPILGSQLRLPSGDRIVLLCQNLQGYGALCHLITELQHGRRVNLEESEGLICLCGGKGSLLARSRGEVAQTLLRGYQRAFGNRLYVEWNNHLEPGRGLLAAGVPAVASNAVQYATRQEGQLCDLLICMKHRRRLWEAERILPLNHERHLKSGAQMRELWRNHPEALARSLEIAEQCNLQLDFSAYRFPDFPVAEGQTPVGQLRYLCLQKVDPQVLGRLEEELRLIEKLGLAGYFLIVHDIVQFARQQGVWVQGRGSAANSLVAYLLGITPVDPVRNGLFLGRFLHEEMECVPDIDLDFSAARDRGVADRETVIQYVYRKYGAEHVAMASTHITFRDRMALRETGMVLGVDPSLINQVARIASRPGWEQLVDQSSPRTRLWLELAGRLKGLPRHLSIHVGGMVIASCPLARLVPMQPARMKDRVVVQWDKDMIEEAGLIKVDLLGLGMLALLQEASSLTEGAFSLQNVPQDDPKVYGSIGTADTVGLFQIESRAQMQSLPRTRPSNLSELAIQVALIRPGPLQGNMVAPYIRRKQGLELVTYPHPATESVLKDTLGVILFQEQVLQVAMVVAGLTPSQADGLRRAMSRKNADLTEWRQRFFEGANRQGVSVEEAQRVFASLEGFAAYGFCKSHAYAFAHLAYLSAWVRTYHPAAYLAALLNSQPMGFYSRETLINDARHHGVRLLPVDVQHSGAYCQLEQGAVRLGLFLVRDLGRAHRDQLLATRPFQSLEDLQRRSGLPTAAIEQLIGAGACDALLPNRRAGWWRLFSNEQLPSAGFDFGAPPVPNLPQSTSWDQIQNEYEALSMPLKAHPMALLRPRLRGHIDSRQLAHAIPNSHITIAGRLECFQKPPTAKGYAFATLEDEFGMINVIIPPPLFTKYRYLLSSSWGLSVTGRLQKEQGVINVQALELSTLHPGC